MPLKFSIAVLVSITFSSACYLAAEESAVSFGRDIRPILADRCFSCHGPDTDAREAGLRLDIATGEEGAHATAIQPGSVEDSELWHRITTDDEELRMPPWESHKPPLTQDEQRLFKAWIDAGAHYEIFWAFQIPKRPELPSFSGGARSAGWNQQPIDRLISQKFESTGLHPAAEADLRTLLRRLTLDLVGLPPTRDEVHNFLERVDSQVDDADDATLREDAFDRVWSNTIDRLLARPQFGEHMARYWLDLVRFADTNGMHKDFYRNNVAYRDWVIRAFNENLGYDDFVRYQLAGDLYDTPTTDQLIASGFHRLHLIIDRGTALPEESFTKNVIDRLTSVGTAFLGLTVHCAQCHDHKYDPITQKDFYSLYAFLNNIDAEPETVNRPDRGLQKPFISLATPEQLAKLHDFDQRLAKSNRQLKSATAELAELEAKTAETEDAGSTGKDRFDGAAHEGGSVSKETLAEQTVLRSQVTYVKKLEQELKKLNQQRRDFDRTVPYAMVMKERAEVRPTHILIRGEYDAPGEEVQRDTPAFLPPLKKSGDVASRMDLANWFVNPAHPLTARVAVNRFWQQFFGIGLVETSEDFGAQGDVPRHPELLEYLTVSFVESGWDVKALVKQIVMSKTYRQSSEATRKQFEEDPRNRLLNRGSRFRLDAEVIRDQVLASSGLLSHRLFGPSVKPPQPKGLWKSVTMTGQVFQADSGEATRRRSLYTFWKRAMPPPQMTILNAPSRAACIARRERTNTPSQALLLLNENEYLKAARELALATLRQNPADRIDYMWETVTSQLPDANERETLHTLVTDLTKKYRDDPTLADALCENADLQSIVHQGHEPAIVRAKLAAWTMVGNTLYNLDITKTRE